MANPTSPRADRLTSNPEWMSLHELCRRTGISLTTGYERARKNTLPVPAVRWVNQFRFSREAYDQLKAAQHDPKPETASEAA